MAELIAGGLLSVMFIFTLPFIVLLIIVVCAFGAARKQRMILNNIGIVLEEIRNSLENIDSRIEDVSEQMNDK